MQNLLKILLRYGNFLVFICLEVAAFLFFSFNNAYPRSSVFSTANQLVAWQHEQVSEIKSYFALKEMNEQLALENAQLRNQLTSIEEATAIRFASKHRHIPMLQSPIYRLKWYK